MFDDIIQKKESKWEQEFYYAPYIPLQVTILEKTGKCIMKEIDREIVEPVIKKANRIVTFQDIRNFLDGHEIRVKETQQPGEICVYCSKHNKEIKDKIEEMKNFIPAIYFVTIKTSK